VIDINVEGINLLNTFSLLSVYLLHYMSSNCGKWMFQTRVVLPIVCSVGAQFMKCRKRVALLLSHLIMNKMLAVRPAANATTPKTTKTIAI
jgi:hypothetical protein